jgi:uncharacterized protein (TIGR02001 family)
MKNTNRRDMIRRLVSHAALPVLALGLPLLAHAEGPEPSFTIAYNVGIVSDYRVRGIAQTAGKPALQTGIDFAHKSGAYVGLAASNVTWVKELNGASKGSVEVDLYGGYKGQINPDWSYDVGLIRYQYPGNDSGVGGAVPAGTFTNANTTEIYGAMSFKMVTLKYNRSLSDFLGNVNSKGSQYLDLSAAIDLTNGFTLIPHVGRQWITNQPGDLGNYSDIALTLTKDFGNGLVGTLAGVKTNADKVFYTDTRGQYLGNSTVLVGMKNSF